MENVDAFDDLSRAMFVNNAPVAPEAALSALERALLGSEGDELLKRCKGHLHLLRSLAYDPALFERCIGLILKIAEAGDLKDNSNEALNVFVSLFFLHLSGTHATIEQRLRVMQPLLSSDEPKRRSLGLMALTALLEAWHFSSSYNFDFGARSRDLGYRPRSDKEVKHWFALTLKLSETQACSDGPSASQVRSALAEKFRGVWTKARMYDELSMYAAPFPTSNFGRRDGLRSVKPCVLTPNSSHQRLLLAGIFRGDSSQETLCRECDQ